jgi:hypothetical protein
MPFDCLVSEVQYAHHLVPVYLATNVPRGTFYVTDRRLLPALDGMGVRAEVPEGRLQRPTLTASMKDHASARRRKAPALAYMEHGCGQSYAGDPRTRRSAAYAGGDGRDGVGIILAPNGYAAEMWRERYPSVPVHVIGATRVLTPPEDPRLPLLVVSFHWSGAIPEQRSALAHYLDVLPLLAQRFPVALHAHPRAVGMVRSVSSRFGIPFLEDVRDAARAATVYAVDNSSTLWEMGRSRPVIALNAPWFRREVTHGLRFWSHIPAAVDGPQELMELADRLLSGAESEAEKRHREDVCDAVIPSVDGALTAATLVAEWSETRGLYGDTN